MREHRSRDKVDNQEESAERGVREVAGVELKRYSTRPLRRMRRQFLFSDSSSTLCVHRTWGSGRGREREGARERERGECRGREGGGRERVEARGQR